MLRARYGLVPFRGREVELADLVAWCDVAEQLGIRLLTGAGGQGKTRLAAQLCQWLAEEGGLTGFLAGDASDVALDRLIDAQGDKLVVVDYADGRIEQVLTLAGRARRSPGAVRLLLLARHSDRWWDRLPYEADWPEPFEDAIVTPLEPVTIDEDTRIDAFVQAVEAISRHLGVDSEDTPSPDLADDTFATLLFVHLAALTAIDPQPDTEGHRTQPIADRLLDETLRREDVKIWAPTSKPYPPLASGTTRRRAVAVATLTTAPDETNAATLLRVIPELNAETAVTVAQWLHGLYSGASYLGPLEPDRLGEYLVARTVAALPTLASDLVAVDDLAHVNRLLAVLTRAADHYDAARTALRVIVDRLAARIVDARDLSTGQLLAAAVDSIDNPATAQAVLDVIPARTTALLDVAVAADETLLRHADDDVHRAAILSDLSLRLAGQRRREEALAAINKAVGHYRRLANARRDEFLPYLATALNNRSPRLAELGRREEALADINEAVGYYRAFADDAPANAVFPDLALFLNTLSIRLADLGRHEEALGASEEAVGQYRALANARPDAFRRDLAMALNNLSNHLANHGRREEGLAAINEAVGHYRTLANTRPDAFLPELATALNTLSNHFTRLGRREEALAAIEEAIRRVLPLLERAWYALPDAGRQLSESYVLRCADLEMEPDAQLLSRLRAVAESAATGRRQVDEEDDWKRNYFPWRER